MPGDAVKGLSGAGLAASWAAGRVCPGLWEGPQGRVRPTLCLPWPQEWRCLPALLRGWRHLSGQGPALGHCPSSDPPASFPQTLEPDARARLSCRGAATVPCPGPRGVTPEPCNTPTPCCPIECAHQLDQQARPRAAQYAGGAVSKAGAARGAALPGHLCEGTAPPSPASHGHEDPWPPPLCHVTLAGHPENVFG